MRRLAVALLTLVFAGACLAQKWEVGGGGGFGFSKNATVTRGDVKADAGFKPGLVVTAFATQNMYERLGGEIRYTLGFSKMKVSSGGTEATFAAQTHAIHYDVLVYSNNSDAAVRGFLIVGAGAKIYRGTGQEEAAAPPLANLAILSRTQQIKGLLVFGAGVKIRAGRNNSLRLEARDYLTPAPGEVIAPVTGAKLSGWIHAFTPTVSLSFGF